MQVRESRCLVLRACRMGRARAGGRAHLGGALCCAMLVLCASGNSTSAWRRECPGTDRGCAGDMSHLARRRERNNEIIVDVYRCDLHGTEAVIVKSTAQVRGNIFAPRIGIMEGATFNGHVEMTTASAVQNAPHGNSSRQQSAPPRPGNSASAATAARLSAPSAPATPSRSATSTPAAPAQSSPVSPPTASSVTAPAAGGAVDQLPAPQTPPKK